MNCRRCLTCLSWGVLLLSRALPAEEATPTSSITVLPGFRVELLRSAAPEDGSWISMTFEPNGSLIVGRDDAGFARLRPPTDGTSTWTCERLNDALKHCRGVLFAHDSLFVNATDSMEFWRFRDLDGDGTYEDSKLLKSFDYRSRFGHGQNQIVLGPDGLLYLVIGNDVSFPAGVNERSPYLDPQKDRLLPDPHDAGQDDRVGYILRTDADGSDWVVIAGGLRNQFDAAFNADGELFTWDADMEWDVGLPWYRPTRLNHIVSGGEYGWRWGTAKWPPYYADSLPANLETGLGSPTGMIFGYTSQFPPHVRDRLFMADWQHGRILSAMLTPDGATYRAETEVFAEGGPLNVCDLLFGPDGALYFITGGRGSQSGLYRITCEGPEQSAAASAAESPRALETAAEARELRKRLEACHRPCPPEAIADIWPHLGNSDRWVRNAARIALEHQPPENWTERIAEEADPLIRSTALLAWVRVADAGQHAAVQLALLADPPQEGGEPLAVLLRAWSILFARGAQPSAEVAELLIAQLAPLYPHPSVSINRDLCELLVFIKSPGIVAATLPLIQSAASQEDAIHYVHALLRYSGPWTTEERTTILRWFRHAATFTGGHLLPQVLANMRQDFLENLSAEERTSLAAVIDEVQTPVPVAQQPSARPLVQRWTLADLLPQMSLENPEHDPLAGRKVLVAAGCLKCHRWEHSGAAIGPDLTSVGKRYSLQMIAESIIDPSKVVDPKYSSTQWLLKSGQIVIGRAAGVQADEITVETNGLTQEQVKIQRDEIEESRPSTVSPMPTGLLDSFTPDEIRELLLFLRGAVAAGDVGGEK